MAKKKVEVQDPILDDVVDTQNEIIKEIKEEVKETPKIVGTQIPLGSKAKAMKEKLAAEPKVSVFVPLASGEKLGVTQSIVLNGYPMFIPKGKYVEVPETVRDVLSVKLKSNIANHPNRIDADGQVKLSVYGS